MRMKTRLRDLYENPVPPMALTDYEEFSKFMDRAEDRCRETGRNFNVILDWAIHGLIVSLTSDSPARIFLPKTRTNQFYLDDLIPISGLEPSGKRMLSLKDLNLIAPVWSNGDLERALEAFYDGGYQGKALDGETSGICIPELRLAIAYQNLDAIYVQRVWRTGSALFDLYPLKSLDRVLSTDGAFWYYDGEDGEENEDPVLDPRMAALYNCALRRYCPENRNEARR